MQPVVSVTPTAPENSKLCCKTCSHGTPLPPLNTPPGKNKNKTKLHWLPISERIKYKVACMCFSAINGSRPAYLSELLCVYIPSRTLRSSDTRMLKIQQYKRKARVFCTFFCFGPHIWNSLQQDLRHCSTL